MMALWNLSSVNTLRPLTTCSLGRASSMSPSAAKLSSSSSSPLFLKPPTLTLSHFFPTPCSTFVRHFHSRNNSSGDDEPFQGDYSTSFNIFKTDWDMKKQIEGRVLYPNTVNLNKVRSMCNCIFHVLINYYTKRVGTVYYGVSVLPCNELEGKITEEEVERLKNEVALKDAMHKGIVEECAHRKLAMCRLGEEPTAKWILEDRIQSSDEEAWDIVFSVNINDISLEEIHKLRSMGVRNMVWFIIAKDEMTPERTYQSLVESGTYRHVSLSDGKFIAFVYRQSFFSKEGPL